MFRRVYHNFYPRSPCGERPKLFNYCRRIPTFLSTLSLRRATKAGYYKILPRPDFYPRSPCGERRGVLTQRVSIPKISIHALLAESDPRCKTCCKSSLRFLSTLSLRRATVKISLALSALGDFYPRSPCGERLEQSSSYNAYLEISIHALLAESD